MSKKSKVKLKGKHRTNSGPQKTPGPRDRYGRLIVELRPDESLQAILEHREKYHPGFGTGVVSDQVHPNDKAVFRTQVKRNSHECALDTLMARGALGSGEDAEIRYRSGEWLRGVYVRSHPSGAVMKFGQGRDQERKEFGLAGWSESKVNDIYLIRDTLRRLGRHARVVEIVCCDDSTAVNLRVLCDGLDLLADLRRERPRQRHQPEQRAP